MLFCIWFTCFNPLLLLLFVAYKLINKLIVRLKKDTLRVSTKSIIMGGVANKTWKANAWQMFLNKKKQRNTFLKTITLVGWLRQRWRLNISFDRSIVWSFEFAPRRSPKFCAPKSFFQFNIYLFYFFSFFRFSYCFLFFLLFFKPFCIWVWLFYNYYRLLYIADLRQVKSPQVALGRCTWCWQNLQHLRGTTDRGGDKEVNAFSDVFFVAFSV